MWNKVNSPPRTCACVGLCACELCWTCSRAQAKTSSFITTCSALTEQKSDHCSRDLKEWWSDLTKHVHLNEPAQSASCSIWCRDMWWVTAHCVAHTVPTRRKLDLGSKKLYRHRRNEALLGDSNSETLNWSRCWTVTVSCPVIEEKSATNLSDMGPDATCSQKLTNGSAGTTHPTLSINP